AATLQDEPAEAENGICKRPAPGERGYERVCCTAFVEVAAHLPDVRVNAGDPVPAKDGRDHQRRRSLIQESAAWRGGPVIVVSHLFIERGGWPGDPPSGRIPGAACRPPERRGSRRMGSLLKIFNGGGYGLCWQPLVNLP